MQIPGLIVMQLVSSERQGVSDVMSDPEYSQVWVLFNARPTAVEFKLPEGQWLPYSRFCDVQHCSRQHLDCRLLH